MLDPEEAMRQAWMTQVEYFNKLKTEKDFIKPPTEREFCAMIIGANIDYAASKLEPITESGLWSISDSLYKLNEIAEKFSKTFTDY